MEAVVPTLPDGLFLGDYFGLAAAGADFVATLTAVDSQKITLASSIGSITTTFPAPL
jgi:hypothetical protein